MGREGPGGIGKGGPRSMHLPVLKNVNKNSPGMRRHSITAKFTVQRSASSRPTNPEHTTLFLFIRLVHWANGSPDKGNE